MERPTLIPELEQLRERVDACRAAAPELARGLSDDEFNARPEPGSWSVAECLDHLIITGSKVGNAIDEALARAHRNGWLSRGPFRYGRIGSWFVRQSVVGGRRVKTMRAYAPQSFRSAQSALMAFDALQVNLIERIEAANGIDLARVRVTSPATPLVRLQLGQWLALLVGHQERHLIQARRARDRVTARA